MCLGYPYFGIATRGILLVGEPLAHLVPGPISRSYVCVATAIHKRLARQLGGRSGAQDRNARETCFPGLRIHGITMRRIHLTFDDGPHAVNTPKLLDALKKADILATFFVVGKNLETKEGIDLVRRAAAEGHQIGNHTYSHPHLTELNKDQIREEILKTESLIGGMNNGIKIFRPPYGHRNSLVDRVVKSLGYRMVLWNVDTLDWHTEHRSRWVERGMEQIAGHRDSIVLAHDVHSTTVENVGKFIASIRSLSCSRFVPPSEAFPRERRSAGNFYLRNLIPPRWRELSDSFHAQS
jgi:peptidoglycan-N-acetylglucosamine deacetylase